MKKRIFYLDFVRTLAVIAVLGCHFTRELEYAGVGYTSKILPDYIFNVYMGSFGVGLFFVVSGASLMYVYSEKLEIRSFYSKRFWAIYPMFWIAYALAFLYEFFRNRGMNLAYPKSRFLLTFLGMDGYLNFYTDTYYLLGEWFLGCLILLYLLFPLLRWAVKKHPFVTAGISLAVFGAGVCYSFRFGFRMNPECWVFMRIPELLFGMYYVEYFKKTHWAAAAVSLGGLIGMQCIDIIWTVQWQIVKTVPVCIAAFLVVTFVSDFLECRPLSLVFQGIGKYSYAIFLCHHFIMMKLSPHFSGQTFGTAELAVMFLLVIVFVAFFSKLLYVINGNTVKWVKSLWKGEKNESGKI